LLKWEVALIMEKILQENRKILKKYSDKCQRNSTVETLKQKVQAKVKRIRT